MIKFVDVEKDRAPDPLGRKQKEGDQFGFFLINSNYDNKTIVVIANGESKGWEHVSCSRFDRTPRWSEMCYIKDLFWPKDDLVIQFHPVEAEYINNAKNCLHLWRYCGDMPSPPSWMVGVKDGRL